VNKVFFTKPLPEASDQPNFARRLQISDPSKFFSLARELSADLLVISTHGYTGWRHFLFGSDAEKILEHACCLTLVVRSDATTRQ
jgi:hypothetical protein